MVFKEIDPIDEIDMELLNFRELLNSCSENRNYLLIRKGGTITQHLVEFLARQKLNITNNIYSGYFRDFLYECDFIQKPVQDFILLNEEYRQEVNKSTKVLDEVILSYLDTFYNILDWFKSFCKYEFFNEDVKFTEIDKTMILLKRRISSEKTNKNDGDLIVMESFNEYDYFEFSEHFPDEYEILIKIALGNQKMFEMLKLIFRTQEIHTEQLNDINYKLDHLLIQLKDLNKNISNYQEEVQKSLENPLSDEEIDKIMNKFTNRCVKQIINYIKNYNLTNEYKLVEKELINSSLGKPAWNKLSSQSKNFLISSKFTYRHLFMLDDVIDYSGVCLLVTKALELELCKRFFRGFMKYLKNEYGDDYTKYHTSLLGFDPKNKKQFRLKNNRCDLGRITYILGYNKDDSLPLEKQKNNTLKLIEYSKKKFFRDLTDEEIEKSLNYYGSLVDDIRIKYRNPAAHTNELKQLDAEECFNLILDVEKVLKKMLDSFDN